MSEILPFNASQMQPMPRFYLFPKFPPSSDFNVKVFRLFSQLSTIFSFSFLLQVEVYVLQLIQALKYEPHHFSSLSFMLLFKALHCKKIGYKFFWMLVAEVFCFQNWSQCYFSHSEIFFVFSLDYIKFCNWRPILPYFPQVFIIC